MEGADVVEPVGSSTDFLIGPEIQHSTGSLVNKDVQQLIGSYKEPESPLEIEPSNAEHADDVDSVLSPIFENYKIESPPPNELSRSFDNAILTRLYNMIQVFLIRQGLTLDFLMIFKNYIRLLIEAKVDPFKDTYLLALQNELSKGYEFSFTLQEVISAFLLKPENYAMKLAHFQFKRNRLVLRKLFLSWQLKSALNSNLAELELIWKKYILKRYLLQWKKTSHLKSKEWLFESIDFYEKRLKAVTFDTWSASLNHLRTKEHIADNFFLDDMLEKMRRKYTFLQNSFQLVCSKREVTLSRAQFNAWKLQLYRSRFVPQASRMLLVRDYFKLFMDKGNFYLTYLQERSEFAERNLALRKRFKLWHQLTFQKLEKTDSLAKKADQHSKSKFFNKLLTARNLVEVEYSVRKRNGKTLGKLMFSLWKKRYHESQSLNEHITIKEFEVLRKYLEYWRMYAAMYNRANIQYAKKLEGRVIKGLKSRLKLLDYERKIDNSAQRVAFNIWSRRFNLRSQEKDFIKSIKDAYFKKMLHRQKSLASLGSLSLKCFEGQIMTNFFTLWKEKHSAIGALKLKANIFMKVKAVNMVKKASKSISFKEVLASEFFLTVDKHILFKYWNIWDHALYTQKLVKLDILMDKFVQRCEKSVKFRIFNTWKRQTDFFLTECLDASDRKYFNSTSLKVYNQWKNKIDARRLLEKEALEISFGMIQSTALHSWILKLEALQKNSRNLLFYAEERNIKLLSKWTNKWSMKVLKLRRNDEMVEMFRSRWIRANLRAVLALWKEKCFDPYSVSGDENTILSNDHIKFQTPMRSHANTLVTIPGSERLKKSKMDRIKDRFSRARVAIPSPIKMSDMLDTGMRGNIARTAAATSSQQNRQNPTQTSIHSNPVHANSTTLSLLNVNKRLADRSKSINFSSIPETSPFGFPSPQPSNDGDSNNLKVDLQFLETEPVNERDDSPTRRRSRT